MVVKPKKKPEEVQTNAGVKNVPVTTTSGTNVIVPAKEAQRLARLGKVQEATLTASDSTKQAVQQEIGAMQLQEGLPEARDIPKPFPEQEKVGGAILPNLGQTATAKTLFEGDEAQLQNIVAQTKRFREAGISPEQAFPENPMAQSILRLDLNERDLAVIKSGEAKVSGFTQVVESIPIIPRGFRQFVGVFATSSKRVQDIETELSNAEKNVNEWATNAASNPHFQEEYLQLINQTEDRMLWLESKLKLIVLQSPDLQAEPEKIDEINQKILGLKISARNAKFKAQGIIA